MDEALREGFVLRMPAIHFHASFVLEGHKEAVGESLSMILRADVGPPLKALDGVDLGRQRKEGVFHSFDLFPGGGILELKSTTWR